MTESTGQKRRGPVWTESQHSLREWYSSGLGQSILEQLGLHLDHILPSIFGYQGLQLGDPGSSSDDSFLIDAAGVHRSIVLDRLGTAPAAANRATASSSAAGPSASENPGAEPTVQETPTGVRLATHPVIDADVLSLPIASDVMKLVLLVHTLDFCEQPHQALREADRVLTDDGQLVIIGFNPWSMMGARHAAMGWRGQVPWNGQFYSRRRVTEWLSVLNYRVLDSRALYLRPPFRNASLLQKMSRLERLQPWAGALGAVYILHARKQTVPMTMSRRMWLGQRTAATVGSLVRQGSASNKVHDPVPIPVDQRFTRHPTPHQQDTTRRPGQDDDSHSD